MSKLLVIVDVQNDFVDGELGTPEAKAIIPKLVDKINNWDGDFVKTFDSHDNNYLETLEGKNLPIPHCIRNTEGWNINKNVNSAISSLLNNYCYSVFKKTFGTTEIGYIVNEYKGDNYDYVEFVGLCTDICVISNVLILKALAPEIKIVVDASCCAGTTPEKHNAALDVMESCQIEILNRNE